MNKIAGMKFKYKYLNSEESPRRLEMAYVKIFQLALKRIKLESLSTIEYINGNGGERGISNTGGGGRETEGKKDNHLPDVPGGQDSGSEVWTGVEDKQPITYGIIPRKGD